MQPGAEHEVDRVLGALDAHLIAEGTHARLYEQLGAHARKLHGVEGATFAVWAPNARSVSVIGEFNDWNASAHPMRRRDDCGVWECFVAGVGHGARYKYEVLGADGAVRHKSDPLALWSEGPPGNASRTWLARAHEWRDGDWMARRERAQSDEAPLSIYEVHVGSWRHREDGTEPTFAELADALVPYVQSLGFTHIELLPVGEHPFAGSWGYQQTALFAPCSRWGDPEGLRTLVERCHAAGIGVLLDWVPAHFPDDEHGLARFDGTCLYEHEDPRAGRHRDWNTLVYNYGRREVANFLVANALYWLREFHFDGLRVDAVASMLYLDYSRAEGDWIPNVHGGRENLEAVGFLRRFNDAVRAHAPRGAITIAEESTAWPLVSHPTAAGGLGFDYKWNMGWMHDTLGYIREDPVHRRYHQRLLTFGATYAFSERFVLAISHDEVVHGKRSLLDRMPGDRWQRFANLRLYLVFLFTQPGKKLLFMGGEFGQRGEWNHDAALEWSAFDAPCHRGVHQLVRDLNRLYVRSRALHERDCREGGFRWIACDDAEHSVVAYTRSGGDPRAPAAVVVCNFTPVPREAYRIGVPATGFYREVLNSDSTHYGGSGLGNLGGVASEAIAAHGFAHSVSLLLPPLAVLVLEPT